MKDPFTFIRDDDARRLVVALDNVATGLSDLEEASMLDDHPAIQYDLRVYTDVIKRATDFLADLRENGHR